MDRSKLKRFRPRFTILTLSEFTTLPKTYTARQAAIRHQAF